MQTESRAKRLSSESRSKLVCILPINYGEFATIRNQSGLNSFKISVKEFVARTGAISLQAKAGRYGGTYAHKDIAFEFAMWISPEFKVYSLPFACTKWSLLWKAGYGYQITKHPCSK